MDNNIEIINMRIEQYEKYKNEVDKTQSTINIISEDVSATSISVHTPNARSVFINSKYSKEIVEYIISLLNNDITDINKKIEEL